jgi:hypothetical protein
MAEPTGPTPEQLANAAKLVESSSAYLKELKKVEKAQKDLNNLYDDANTIAEATVKLAKEREKLDKDALAIGKLQEENLIARKKTEAEIAKQSRINKKEAKKDREKRLAGLKILQENLKGLESETQTYKEQSKLNQKALRDLDKKSKTIQKNIDLEEKYGKEVKKNLAEAEQGNQRLFNAQAKIAKQIPGIGGALGKALDMKTKALDFSTNIGKLGAEMAKLGGKAGDIGKALEGASKHMTKFFEGIGLGSIAVLAFVGYLVKMALDVNNLSKELGASTGFGDKFNSTITAMGQSGHMAGIGFKESAAALKGLTEGLSSFNPNAEDTNAHLGMTVARLEKLGVSSGASVKSIDHMQRAMGMTAKQAADTTAQVARMGKEIGITGTKMINDFNAASGRLAIYGKENIKVFKELAAQAKATGIEMGSLLNISSKFDKFDSAAESVGQLNAVLGTQLSTIEMINASDSEKIMLMKQEVQASVGNFDALDKHTKQYIAHAMGVKDVAEAQRLLNMSNAEYEKYQKGQKESADIQKELAAATAEMVPLLTQLKLIAIQLFMAFEPLISGFSALFAGINYLYTAFTEFNDGIEMGVKMMTALKFIFTALSIVAVAFAGFISWPVAAVLGFVAALGALWDIVHKPGSKSMAEGMFDKDIGASMGRLGADAAGAQKDISDLSSEMEGMHDAVHKGGGNAIDIQAMASLDTSAIAAGFDKIKSAVMELSSVKIDGFLAMTTDGTSSSFVMGSDGLIKSISEGKLVVDVKMPEMQMPDISVKVYIGDRELRDIIRTEAKAVVGRAG